MFSIELSRRATKALADLPGDYREAMARKLVELERWPDHQADVCALVNNPLGTHRLRVGNYRAVLIVDDVVQVVTVVRVAHRSKVYD